MYLYVDARNQSIIDGSPAVVQVRACILIGQGGRDGTHLQPALVGGGSSLEHCSQSAPLLYRSGRYACTG